MCDNTLAVVGIPFWFEYRDNCGWDKSGQGFGVATLVTTPAGRRSVGGCTSTAASLPFSKSDVILLYKHRYFPQNGNILHEEM